jgi:muramoyltetrapeptide carboxypeptidase
LTRILDALDYNVIKANPKPFVGFSAITGLVNAISQRCGFVTYHGPMALSFAMEHDPRTEKDFFAVVGGGKELSISGIDVLRPGKAEGTLIGGNMTSMQCLIGTKFDWTGKDAILFIEDVDEILYKIDRTLEHLKQAGKFQNVRAVIVGEMLDTPDGESQHMRPGDQPYGRDLKQIVRDVVPSDIPVCINFPCGHGKYMTTLPVGAKTQLTLDKTSATLRFTTA